LSVDGETCASATIASPTDVLLVSSGQDHRHGEGGAITTNDAALAKHMARDRTHACRASPATFIQTAGCLDAAGEPNPGTTK